EPAARPIWLETKHVALPAHSLEFGGAWPKPLSGGSRLDGTPPPGGSNLLALLTAITRERSRLVRCVIVKSRRHGKRRTRQSGGGRLVSLQHFRRYDS